MTPPNPHLALVDAVRGRPPSTRGLVDGGSFLLDIPPTTPALWGSGHDVLHPEGEGLVILGPQSTGKTTLAGQLALGFAGLPGFEELLGFPVKRIAGRVLYLALDRPQQIARALRRMVDEEHRAMLDERLVVWRGPLPIDIAERPMSLAKWAWELKAGVVFIDSLKDVAGMLSEEKVGAAINAAVQECLAEGIETVALHHPRKKSGGAGKEPTVLDDAHGAGNLTRGMGSVLSLWGEAGATSVELRHLKPVVGSGVGPLTLRHDYHSGRTTVGSPAESAASKEPFRPTGYMERVSREIEQGERSRNAIEQAGLGRKEYVRMAMDMLVSEGYATERIGSRNARLLLSVQAFREADLAPTSPIDQNADLAPTSPQREAPSQAESRPRPDLAHTSPIEAEPTSPKPSLSPTGESGWRGEVKEDQKRSRLTDETYPLTLEAALENGHITEAELNERAALRETIARHLNGGATAT